MLATLRDTGFITYGNQHIGAANTALIVTGGALGDDAGNQGATVARFAAGMAPHGSGTVLVGRDGSASGTAAVAVARSDAALSTAVSTVDDIDSESGRLTAVLALGDLTNGGTARSVRHRPGRRIGNRPAIVHCRHRRVSDGLSVSVLGWFPWVGRPKARNQPRKASPCRVVTEVALASATQAPADRHQAPLRHRWRRFLPR